jgi:hypothetical protein
MIARAAVRMNDPITLAKSESNDKTIMGLFMLRMTLYTNASVSMIWSLLQVDSRPFYRLPLSVTRCCHTLRKCGATNLLISFVRSVIAFLSTVLRISLRYADRF